MYFLGAQTSFRCVGGCDVLEERAYPFCGEGENIRKMDKDTGLRVYLTLLRHCVEGELSKVLSDVTLTIATLTS